MTTQCEDCGVSGDEEDLEEFGDSLLCHECKREYKCRSCWGRGTYPIRRDPQGRLDYIRGKSTGEIATCNQCHGEGYTC